MSGHLRRALNDSSLPNYLPRGKSDAFDQVWPVCSLSNPISLSDRKIPKAIKTMLSPEGSGMKTSSPVLLQPGYLNHENVTIRAGQWVPYRGTVSSGASKLGSDLTLDTSFQKPGTLRWALLWRPGAFLARLLSRFHLPEVNRTCYMPGGETVAHGELQWPTKCLQRHLPIWEAFRSPLEMSVHTKKAADPNALRLNLIKLLPQHRVKLILLPDSFPLANRWEAIFFLINFI